jgi:hypothetical protein
MIMEIPERIYVQTPMFEGFAKVLFVLNGEMYPVQVELEEPDEDGHRVKRVAWHEIKKDASAKSNSEIAVFKDSEDPRRFLVKTTMNHEGYGFKEGVQYIVGPTRQNKGTHYYVYDLNDTWTGCFPTEWFEAIEEYRAPKRDCTLVVPKLEKSDEIGQKEVKSVQFVLKNEIKPDKTEKYEQLSLF